MKMNRTEALARLTEYGLSPTEAETLVSKAEAENCEPTSQLQDDNDTTIEYKASALSNDKRSGVDVFYYPEKSEFVGEDGEPIDDLGNIDWQIDHYDTF
jgi:hypothetical protein